MEKIFNIAKSFLSSTFSGYASILLAAGCGILITYITTLNVSINNYKEEIKGMNTKISDCNSKILIERERTNNNIKNEILQNNNQSLIEENKRLLNANSKLSEIAKSKEVDIIKISNEANKLKENGCLNSEIDDKTKEVLNKMFNGDK